MNIYMTGSFSTILKEANDCGLDVERKIPVSLYYFNLEG